MDESTLISEQGRDFLTYALSKAVPDVPIQYRDVLKQSKEEQEKWRSAMADEIKAIEERNVWTLVDLPKDRKTVKCRWVYARKSDGRYRARLVAKGFSQVYGVDFEETFSPVARFETVRMLLAHACHHNWEIETLDVKTAFLHGKLDEEIYMEQPEGFRIKGKEKKVYRLQRALYGLKQAALAWNKELHQSLLKLGFERSKSDAGVYVHRTKNHIMLFVIYVDDGLLLSSSTSLLQKKKKQFLERWDSRDMGPAQEYLGIQILRDRQRRTMHLHQIPYVQKVLERFKMTGTQSVRTPLPAGYQPTKAPEDYEAHSELKAKYQSVIGSLMFVMLGTRPDLAFATIKMSQFMANPTEEHLSKAYHILRYLASTSTLCLHYSRGDESSLFSFADSDWAGDRDSRRSTSGFAFFLGSNCISWRSRRQPTVALSSTEAEYMSLCDAATQIKWIQSLFRECHIPIERTVLFGDNKGALFLAGNPAQEGRSKHIDIKYYFLRECVDERIFLIDYISTKEQRADMMTKNLTWQLFSQNRQSLGMVILPK